jgi:hypothetical protein
MTLPCAYPFARLAEPDWQPFGVRRIDAPVRKGDDVLISDWDAGAYTVALYHRPDFAPMAQFAGEPEAMLQISSVDGTARHDWRDFQHIKNSVLGKEWHGVEVYPTDADLRDPSNAFYLLCWLNPGKRLGFLGKRIVMGAGGSLAPQRGGGF